MKSIFAFLLTLSLSLSVFGQASKQVLSVGTIADLHARRPQSNEVVSVRHGSASNLWVEPRLFVHDPASVLTADGVHVLTNAAASGRYVSQDRESAMQNVAWWGAVGNGTTDDTAALQAAAAAITTGKTLFAPAGKTFLTTNSITLTNSRVRVDFSGSTIKFTGTTRRSALQLGPTVSVVSGMDFAISTSTNYVTGVPSSTFATGDMVMLYNSVESPANYNPGQLAFVTAASGTTMTLDRFPDTGLQITNAYRFVSAPEGIEIRNVVVDLSGATDGIGISAVGRGHIVEGCRVIGTGTTNDPNYIGIELRGQSITARNNFVQGILDAGNASDRSGYGIFLAGDNIVAENNELADCKHCISSSERKAISRELRIINNRIRQRDDWARLTDVNGAYLFTAALDVHANVRHATIKGNDIKIGGRYALSLRNGNFEVIGNTVEVTEQPGLPFSQHGSAISEAFVTRGLFFGNQFKTPTNTIHLYFDRADSGVAGTHSNLVFIGNDFNGAIFGLEDNGTGITNAFVGVTLSGNVFRRDVGTPVLLTGAMRDWLITGNRIEYGGGNGISILHPDDGSGGPIREIFVDGNAFTRLAGAGSDVKILGGPTNVVEMGRNKHGPVPASGTGTDYFEGRVAVSQTPAATANRQAIEADASELIFNSTSGTRPARLRWGSDASLLSYNTGLIVYREGMTNNAFSAYHTDTNGLPFVDRYNFVIKSDGLMSWSDGDNAAQIVLGPRRIADVTNGVIRLSGGLGLSERTEPIQPSSTTATIWLEEADSAKSIKVKWPDGSTSSLYPQGGGGGTNSWKIEVNTTEVTEPDLTDTSTVEWSAAGSTVSAAVKTGSLGTNYLTGAAYAALKDLGSATGTLAGSQVGSGINDDNVAFDDADNLWTATAVGPALEELNDSINSGVPNGTGAKLHWSQLLGVPAGFADGTDDGAGGGSGDVVGPASSTDSVVALYDGTTGKLLKDGTLTEAAISANLTEAEASALYQKTNTVLTTLGTTDGGALTNLNASNLASGTVPTNRLAASITGKQDALVNSAGLAGALSDETGSGAAVFGTSPTLASPTITGTLALDAATVGTLTVTNPFPARAVTNATASRFAVFGADNRLTNDVAETGSGAPVRATSPVLVTPTLGAASATSLTLGATNVVTELALKAPLASPALTGTPTVNGTNLMAAIASAGGGGGGLTMIDGSPITNVNFRSSYYSKATVSSATNVDWIPQPVSSASTASFTPAFNSSRSHEFTLTNTATLNAPSGVTTDMVGDTFRLVFIQDATGSRTLTAATNYLFGTDITGLTLTTNAGARDYAVVYVRRTNVFDVIGFVRGYAQ